MYVRFILDTMKKPCPYFCTRISNTSFANARFPTRVRRVCAVDVCALDSCALDVCALESCALDVCTSDACAFYIFKYNVQNFPCSRFNYTWKILCIIKYEIWILKILYIWKYEHWKYFILENMNIENIVYWKIWTLKILYIGKYKHWKYYILENMNIENIIYWKIWPLKIPFSNGLKARISFVRHSIPSLVFIGCQDEGRGRAPARPWILLHGHACSWLEKEEVAWAGY